MTGVETFECLGTPSIVVDGSESGVGSGPIAHRMSCLSFNSFRAEAAGRIGACDIRARNESFVKVHVRLGTS